eukprot:TRINITY_DN457_c1_g1_i2.p1 TRINITY_DN457_c1_g1~~TRINITY_DN457_c1_g1_i2.p1  ORF type:complete len:937 (+),score=214.40 TRINITY_DN457_c1_g1_i2:67-2811(+)
MAWTDASCSVRLHPPPPRRQSRQQRRRRRSRLALLAAAAASAAALAAAAGESRGFALPLHSRRFVSEPPGQAKAAVAARQWRSSSRRWASAGVAADNISLVKPLVQKLPASERETLLGLLRLLSLPVQNEWLPFIELALLRLGLLRLVAKVAQRTRRWLSSYTTRIESAEEAAALAANLDSGRTVLKTLAFADKSRRDLLNGAVVLSPRELGPELELAGFQNPALNVTFAPDSRAAAAEATANSAAATRSGGVGAGGSARSGQRVLLSADGTLVLTTASLDGDTVWVVCPVAAWESSKGDPLANQLLLAAALAVSPPGLTLQTLIAGGETALGWRERDATATATPGAPGAAGAAASVGAAAFPRGSGGTAPFRVVTPTAGVASARLPPTPFTVRAVPPGAPRVLPYEHTYWHAVQTPAVAWCSCFVLLQMLEWFLVPRASTKQVTEQLMLFLGRARCLATVSSLASAGISLIGKWKARRSRGTQHDTDVLGQQSSQREARLSSLSVTMQVGVMIAWAICVMFILGINVGRVLLVPSIGAILLGFVGKDIISNVLSSLVIYVTQPFAQGDWVTLETGQDGWVSDIGLFYTRVIQWDKRPLYVPNFRLVEMLIQNNSRMTNRRIKLDLRIRLQDIPKIPAIVNDLQKMIEDHADIDRRLHRLCRWRGVGDYYATVWLSCYTKPTMDGITLRHYIAVQQSILERAAAVMYKYGADFASSLERSAARPGRRPSPVDVGGAADEEHRAGAADGGWGAGAAMNASASEAFGGRRRGAVVVDAEWAAAAAAKPSGGVNLVKTSSGRNEAEDTRGATSPPDGSERQQLQDAREQVLKVREDELRARERELGSLADELEVKQRELLDREALLREAAEAEEAEADAPAAPAAEVDGSLDEGDGGQSSEESLGETSRIAVRDMGD